MRVVRRTKANDLKIQQKEGGVSMKLLKLLWRALSIVPLAVVVYGSVPAGASMAGLDQPVIVAWPSIESRLLGEVWSLALHYGNSEGHLASYQQMKQEGRIFFAFKNPYTGEDLQESCSKDAEPGSICIRLMDAYHGAVEMRGKAGETLVQGDNIPLNTIRVPEWRRGKENPIIQRAKALGYTDEQLRLVYLGQELVRAVLSLQHLSLEGNGSADAWLEGFRTEPYKNAPLRDPITGNWLSFDGRGFGNRVVFSEGSRPGRLRMQIRDDSNVVVFDGEFFSGAFSETVSNEVLKGKEWRFDRFLP